MGCMGAAGTQTGHSQPVAGDDAADGPVGDGGSIGSGGRDGGSDLVDARLVGDERLTAWGLFTEAHARVEQRLARVATDAHDLPLAWYEVLLRLARTPGHRLRMTELADQVSFSASGLSRLADRMERAGLIDRALCRTDRRGTEAVLTPQGADVLHDATRTLLDVIQARYVARLSPEELEVLDRALRRVRDADGRPGDR